jgi:hypothetical protein
MRQEDHEFEVSTDYIRPCLISNKTKNLDASDILFCFSFETSICLSYFIIGISGIYLYYLGEGRSPHGLICWEFISQRDGSLTRA